MKHSDYIARLTSFMALWDPFPANDISTTDQMQNLTEWVEYLSGARDEEPK